MVLVASVVEWSKAPDWESRFKVMGSIPVYSAAIFKPWIAKKLAKSTQSGF